MDKPSIVNVTFDTRDWTPTQFVQDFGEHSYLLTEVLNGWVIARHPVDAERMPDTSDILLNDGDWDNMMCGRMPGVFSLTEAMNLVEELGD